MSFALTLDLPPEGSSALLAAMRAQPEWEKIPVLALAESAAQIHTPAVQTAGFQDCQIKSDPVRVLESVARLDRRCLLSRRCWFVLERKDSQ